MTDYDLYITIDREQEARDKIQAEVENLNIDEIIEILGEDTTTDYCERAALEVDKDSLIEGFENELYGYVKNN